MEPADLNSSPDANGDARLEALLRRATTPLDDDGFSARVLAALPAPVKPRVPWQRILFCIAGALAGCGYAVWRGVSGPAFETGIARLGNTLADFGPSMTDPRFVTAMGVTVLSLALAFRTELREKFLP